MKSKLPIMVVMIIIVLVGLVYAVQGVGMHNEVATQEEEFHELQSQYFSNSKEVRDKAPTGSNLNKDLVKIVNFPSELLRLKLVGVGKILTGIFIILFGILIALVMMPVRLGEIIKENSREKEMAGKGEGRAGHGAAA